MTRPDFLTFENANRARLPFSDGEYQRRLNGLRAIMAAWMVKSAEEIALIRPGARCSEITAEINRFFATANLLQYRSFGYGHSFGLLSHYYGREAGLELRADVDTVLAPGHVISMEPMLTIPAGQPGAGGYREHDILVVGEDSAENITGFAQGPEHNIIPV